MDFPSFEPFILAYSSFSVEVICHLSVYLPKLSEILSDLGQV